MLRRFFFIFGRLGMGIGSTAILLCWNVLPARAQMGSVGTVNVIVLDPSGSAVQGAMLQLQDLATNETHSAETQQVGSYSFVTIPLGTYKLTVRKTGFETLVLSSVVVQGGRVTDVKVTLRVGAATETVIVESATPLVEATSNAIATTIDMKQINELPLQGRNIATLAFLSAGYSGTPVAGGEPGTALPAIPKGTGMTEVFPPPAAIRLAG